MYGFWTADHRGPLPAFEIFLLVADFLRATFNRTARRDTNSNNNMGWEDIIAKLPVEKTEEQFKERSRLFDAFDPNGNGYLSLAECDKGCRDILGVGGAMPKPVIMRAYTSARDVAQKDGKNQSKNGGDYIERSEFRLFLVCLSRYLELWKMFSSIDENHDRRVTFDEFKHGLGKVAEWGVNVRDPKATFDKIDENGGGKILFDEFVKWAMDESIHLVEKD